MIPDGEITFETDFFPEPGLEDALLAVFRHGVTYEVSFGRTWRERLFSWPWRPWHNERVYEMVDAEAEHVGGGEVAISSRAVVTRTRRAPHGP